MDFLISDWISGFQIGFLDCRLDFWISQWISGFQLDFWISQWISGFQFADSVRDFFLCRTPWYDCREGELQLRASARRLTPVIHDSSDERLMWVATRFSCHPYQLQPSNVMVID